MGHAKAILSLNSPELRAKLTDLIVEKQLNVRDAEKESRKLLRRKKENGPKKSISYEEFEERLQQQFGTKVQIENSKKGGKISLHFYSMEDLERLLSRFGALEEI